MVSAPFALRSTDKKNGSYSYHLHILSAKIKSSHLALQRVYMVCGAKLRGMRWLMGLPVFLHSLSIFIRFSCFFIRIFSSFLPRWPYSAAAATGCLLEILVWHCVRYLGFMPFPSAAIKTN